MRIENTNVHKHKRYKCNLYGCVFVTQFISKRSISKPQLRLFFYVYLCSRFRFFFNFNCDELHLFQLELKKNF